MTGKGALGRMSLPYRISTSTAFAGTTFAAVTAGVDGAWVVSTVLTVVALLLLSLVVHGVGAASKRQST
ncbi:hypothetical protein SAMN04488570_1130 [Nocardioides scoriae]|uniref:Uncharacterized protein n=1 Tax=Nocardioides scoriae TaxID=642780 RepID=A0A1H1PG68_9ACTN|nr:hypothetical protein SAMN04488570_1130 [Nocardioides scoriae]